jgi:hypothetical protein
VQILLARKIKICLSSAPSLHETCSSYRSASINPLSRETSRMMFADILVDVGPGPAFGGGASNPCTLESRAR